MKLLDWKILYADGKVLSNLDGEAWEATRNGVMQTFYMDESTGVSVEGSLIGHWVWKSNRWFGCDDHMGFWDYMFHYPGKLTAVFGRTLHNEEWEADIRRLSIEIMNEPKTAWRPRERRAA